MFSAQNPSQHQQADAPQGHAAQPQLDGDEVALGRVFEEKSHAKKDNHHADFEHRIALGAVSAQRLQ